MAVSTLRNVDYMKIIKMNVVHYIGETNNQLQEHSVGGRAVWQFSYLVTTFRRTIR